MPSIVLPYGWDIFYFGLLLVMTNPDSISVQYRIPQRNGASKFRPFSQFIDRYSFEFEIAQYVV